MKILNNKNNRGFTIVELMIATTIFSVVLMVASIGVVAIGRMYYKSLTSTRVQETARSIMNDISSSLQFSDTDAVASYLTNPDGTPSEEKVRCFGPDRYTYVINQKVEDGRHALYRDRRPSESECRPNDSFSSGTELLGDNMRLLQFDVSNSDPFSVKIKIAFGDNDLLTNYPDDAGPETSPISGIPFEDVNCKFGIAGSNFCAVSGLETTLTSRVE